MLICVATTTNQLNAQQTYHLTILGLSIEPNLAAVHSRQRLIKQQNTKGPEISIIISIYEGRDQETSGAYRLGQRRSGPVVACGGGGTPVPAPAAAVELVHPLARPPPPAAVAATVLLLQHQTPRGSRSGYWIPLLPPSTASARATVGRWHPSRTQPHGRPASGEEIGPGGERIPAETRGRWARVRSRLQMRRSAGGRRRGRWSRTRGAKEAARHGARSSTGNGKIIILDYYYSTPRAVSVIPPDPRAYVGCVVYVFWQDLHYTPKVHDLSNLS